MADSAFVRVVLLHPDPGFQPQLLHELVDQLMVDRPSFPSELSVHTPVTITTVHPLEDLTDSLFELSTLVSPDEALLVIEIR